MVSSYVVFRQQRNPQGGEYHMQQQNQLATNTDGWSVIPTATSSYSFTGDDEERSQTLWRWGQHRILVRPTIHPEHRCTLENLALAVAKGQDFAARTRNKHKKAIIGQNLDLTAMVSAIIPFPPSQRQPGSPCGLLRVWDGTGLPRSDP